EIAVSRHDQCGVESIVEGVRQHLRSNVDVRHLFLVVHPSRAALAALTRLVEVVPELERCQRPCFKRFDVERLPAHVVHVVAVGTDARREVVQGLQLLSWLQQRKGQLVKIQPVVLPPSLAAKAEVQVEAIDVGDNAGHAWPSPVSKTPLTVTRAAVLSFGLNPAGDRISGPTPPPW